MQKYRDVMYVWNAREGSHFYDPEKPPGIRIVPLSDGMRLSQGYTNSDGACFKKTKSWSKHQIQLKLVINMMHLVEHYNLTFDEVHEAFLSIEEYADIDFNACCGVWGSSPPTAGQRRRDSK